MSLLHTRTRRVIAATVVCLAIAGGAAFAAWMLTGSGSAGGSVGQPLGLTATAEPAANVIYPGGQGDAAFSVNNPNGFPVTVDTATLGALTLPSGCSASDITETANSPYAGLAVTIPANSTGDVVLPNAFQGANDLSASCVGVNFSAAVALTAHSGS